MADNRLEEYLNQKGFNLVELPRQDIKIFDVLHEEERGIVQEAADKIFNSSFFVNYLGEIDTFFEAKMSLPVNFAESKYNKWSDATVDVRKAGLSFSFLTNLIGGINSNISADILFKQTEKIKLSFNDVIIEKYSKELLGQYINKGKLKRGIHHSEDFKKGRVFIIYEVAKSKSISLEMYDKNEDLIKLSGEAKKLLSKAGVSISNETESQTNVDFEGENKLVFAFKAIQLEYIGTFYKLSKEKRKELLDAGIPEDIYNLLYKITDIEYKSEKEFLTALQEWLINDQLETYKHLFLEYCLFDNFKTKDTKVKHRAAEGDVIDKNPVFINIAKEDSIRLL